MNPAQVDWAPALIVLAIGVVVGAAVVWRILSAARRVPAVEPVASVEVRDLAGKSEALLRQLRELEDTASKRTPEQLARERYALELEAAQTFLALDERTGAGRKTGRKGAAGEPVSAATNPVAAAPPARAGLRGFLWGTGSATALLLLAFFVYQQAKPREPGGSATGEVGMSGRAGDAPPDAQEAELQAAVSRNPDDVEERLALARLYVERQEWMRVWNETTRILERSPNNPRALAYQALVRLAMGQGQAAVSMLTTALAAEPDMIDGWAYLTLALARSGRMKEAEATVAKATKRFPDRAEDLRRFLAQVRTSEASASQASPAAGGEADPHASLRTPGEAAAAGSAAPAPSAAKGRRVSGTIDLDPSLKGVATGRILFVFAREAGGSGGPPVAVKRLPPVFPASFELSESDSMMGQPFPETLLIEARLDEDGDPTTRPPTDPKARLDGVKVGRTNLKLVLKRGQ
ncbi:MAG TPA: tetratricopeptide repeat protein [Myxococcales bacterium]|nr:tetratricopeptide repeat protein [Myxococcales bacterium]